MLPWLLSFCDVVIHRLHLTVGAAPSQSYLLFELICGSSPGKPDRRDICVISCGFLQAQPTSTAAVATLDAPAFNALLSQDEEDQGTEVRQCVAALRDGKRCATVIPGGVMQIFD